MVNEESKILGTKKPDDDVEIIEQINTVKKYISEQKPYLDSSLTMQDLARQLNMSTRDLSILINHHLNQHFFDFVNEYRIKKAMSILEDPSSKNLTILEILFDVGFNSKSPFNTAFKKHTNVTPTVYRQTFHKHRVEKSSTH